MKTITRFVNALETLFQVTNMGAYFVPMFRPMVTEQERLRPIRVRQETDETARLLTFLSGSPGDRPGRS